MTRAHRQAYFPYVDGLRAIAVLSVVIYHLKPTWLPGGFSGVDIFFVISGFIVSASVGSMEKTRLPGFATFFIARRLQRIAPALIVCLLITTFATAVFVPAAWLSQSNQQTGLYAFVGLSNFILAGTNNNYFSPTSEYNPFTHTWSLGVEEQFYLIFPVLFFLWTFRGKWRLATVVLFAAAFLASYGYSASIAVTDKTTAFYMIGSRFWELATGVLLYQFMTFVGRNFDTPEQPSPRWFTLGAVFSLAAIGYGFVAAKPHTFPPPSFPFPGAIPSVLGSIGLLGFLHGKTQDNWLIRVIACRPMLYVGRISYSLYLWHWPVFVLFRWTVGTHGPAHQLAALLIAFVLAVLSYRWVETPIRSWQALREAPRLAIVVCGVACIGASVWLSLHINAAQASISISTVSRHPDDWYPDGQSTDPRYPGCVVSQYAPPVGTGFVILYARQGCVAATTGPRIFVIGDSHAMAYQAMFKGYVLATGAPVSIYNNGGCPFLSLQPWREDSEHCRLNAKAAVDDMLTKIKPGDVVFLPSLRLPRFADQAVGEVDAPAREKADASVREQIFGELPMAWRSVAEVEGETTLRQLEEKGAKVVIEAPNVVFRSPTFRCADFYNRTNPMCKDGTTIDRAELEQLREPIVASLQKISAAVPNVVIWDPFPILCPPAEKCSEFLNGKPLFFDGDHISGYANQVLLPSFMQFVSANAQ